jgi:O-antigen/teichoic acid export membrane protein
VNFPLRLLLPMADIGGFFNNLYGQLTVFAGAMTIFFFALSALFYGASVLMSSERARSHAIASLYGALIGLALTLLAGTIAGIVETAANGQ